ncbi:ribbon-helix-helix protein, CopG family [Streptomyces deserti]
MDHDLLDRLRHHAVQKGNERPDHVVRTLIRDDFDERFPSSVEETERFYGVT